MPKNKISGLYAITPNKKININAIENIIKKHPIRILQYRHKTEDTIVKIQESQALKELCIANDIIFIINNDVKLCKKIKADGVHLGKTDTPLLAARKFLGNKYIIGASCYNEIDLAIQAEKNSADYVAFGAMYLSNNKKDAPICPLSTIKIAKKRLNIPIVAIGGINFSNKKYPISAGVNAVAMIDALFENTYL